MAFLWCTSAVRAQSTTGTIVGRVTDSQGLNAPGVTVEAASPSVQGVRTTITSANGDYILSLLPSGDYIITFELPGFARVDKRARLAPTQLLPVDATLSAAAAEAFVQVTGRSADVLTRTAQVATNVAQSLVASLPTNRDIFASLFLSRSVHGTGPLGAPSINGGMSFGNLYMVNGVAIGDNLRGQPYELYIEDAIQETTIATAGMSAEYGRFSGGVINVVTKSGGNRFSGSLRDTLVNDNWRTLTPFEDAIIAADASHLDTRVDRTVPTYEYTLGGPVLKNRLWFFVAGRHQTLETGRTLAITNIPYTFESRQRRYEGKATYAVSPNHRLQGTWIDSTERLVNQAQNPSNVMDLNSLFTARRPMNLFTLEYNAIVSPRLFVEARISARNETLKDVGSQSTDLIAGTLLIDRSGRRYWSPTFCGVCGAEQRDGRDIFLKGSTFVSSPRAGAHIITFGYDGYDDQRYANNHQSGSDFRITGTNAILRGTDLTAQFLADGLTQIVWQPILVTTEGTHFRTHSGFYSDNWRISDRVSANLGLRYDRNHARDSSGQQVARSDAWSPRLGIIVDPWGDEKWAVSASVARYVEALANTVANAASAAGNPDTYQFAYLGPEINRNTAGSLTSTADGIRQVMDWFTANGGISRPVVGANVVGVTPIIGDTLKSPDAWEYAFGISRQAGSRAVLRADFTYRDYGNFYSLRTDTGTGTVVDTRPQAPIEVRGRRYDLGVIQNSDLLSRQYSGLSLQGQYRIGSSLETGATYTLSRAWGNFDGENGNGPTTSTALQYPEYKQPSWSYPVGDLSIDQRHRGRLWANYRLPWLPTIMISALQILESGVPYGAVSPSGANPQISVANPGYVTPPTGQTTQYYFTDRDAFRTEGQVRTDFAISFAHKLQAIGGLELFGQLQLLNAFDAFQLCACGASTVLQDGNTINTTRLDQSVRTAVTVPGAYTAFDPMTTTPVEGTNWGKGANFGQALNRFAYTTPRTVRLTFGIRF